MPVVATVPVILKARVKRVDVNGKAIPDARGNDQFDDVATTVDGVFAPGGSIEQVQGHDVVIDQPRVFLRTGTVVAAIDAINVGGLDYEVTGDPAEWPPNPFTGRQPEFSVEVKLERVTG